MATLTVSTFRASFADVIPNRWRFRIAPRWCWSPAASSNGCLWCSSRRSSTGILAAGR
jgi:hypothetical protein